MDILPRKSKIMRELFIIYVKPVIRHKFFSITTNDGIDVHNPNRVNNYVDPLKFFNWIQDSSPGFSIKASKIAIIHEPSVFYSTLLGKCKKAEKRITLASLYLGTGKFEKNIVQTIGESLSINNRKLKVNILLDYMRGTRGKDNSRKMLQPLVQNHFDKCRVYLYHTPKLRSLLKKLMPNRFNELIGLQHMKVYIFDDCLIISGANLSHDYFTNRQDRYFVIENCQELCNFYDKLIKIISEFSFQLLPDDEVSFEIKSNIHPLKSTSHHFSSAVRKRINSLIQDELMNIERRSLIKNASVDTLIFPLIQMGQLGIFQDEEITLTLFKTAPSGAKLRLATGYFNLTMKYSNAILRDCRALCQFLTAHPTTNGFFGAKGIAGNVPAAYTTIEKSFFKKCEKLCQLERVSFREYIRPGWTYHAKGVWYTLPNQNKPSLTFIGSSNFGYRSVKRDLETQIVIVTNNEKLQDELEKECDMIYQNSKTVTRNWLSQHDRFIPFWISAVVFLFRHYL